MKFKITGKIVFSLNLKKKMKKLKENLKRNKLKNSK